MSSAVPSPTSSATLIVVLAISSTFAPLSVDFFAPSMPDATRALGSSAVSMQNSLYIFFLGYAISPFAWGQMADRIGRRRSMLIGISIYGLASLACLFTTDILWLCAMRLFQGIGASSGIVIARAVMRDIHGPSGATKAISGMFLIMVWVPIVAPIMGGYLATQYEWQTSFVVMSVVAALCLASVYRWLEETAPDHQVMDRSKNIRFNVVLIDRTFLRNALANMFCVGTMLLFLANYSYLSESLFQATARDNGYVLALFNIGVSFGVYLVRILAPRFGVEQTVSFGLWVGLSGWIALYVLSRAVTPEPTLLMVPVLIACLGTGMVISLTVGQALVPFAFGAGVASALFVFLQSAGSSLISFLVGLVFDITLNSITVVLVACSLLALVSMKSIRATERQ